jgi:predicted RNA-binding Zn-ribbon protein involved in translation (DUF1610 family)
MKSLIRDVPVGLVLRLVQFALRISTGCVSNLKDLIVGSQKAVKPCPNCGSRDVRHKDENMRSVNHSAAHLGGHEMGHTTKGHPGILLVIAGVWAVTKVIHSCSEPWTCKKCQHTYS